jgi:hypothetical protein
MRNLVIPFMILSALFSSTAHGYATKGDAQAILLAGPAALTDGMISHGGYSAPEHLGPENHIDIRPYNGSPYDGAHYCVDDWHVILVAWFEFVWEKPSTDRCLRCLQKAYVDPLYFTTKDVVASFSRITNVFTLDGEYFDGPMTEIKPMNSSFGDDFVDYVEAKCGCDYTVTNKVMANWGSPVSPSELAVGEHTLSSVFSYPGGVINFAINFFVDGHDAPICSQ